MTTVVVSVDGADIVVSGGLAAEFNAVWERDHGEYLVFSDGTVLYIDWDKDWRTASISVAVQGSAHVSIVAPVDEDDVQYDDEESDRAVLDGPISWVVHGVDLSIVR